MWIVCDSIALVTGTTTAVTSSTCTNNSAMDGHREVMEVGTYSSQCIHTNVLHPGCSAVFKVTLQETYHYQQFTIHQP